MTLPPTLLIRVLPALALVAAFAGEARAQEYPGVTVEFMLPNDSGDYQVIADESRIVDYFNLARCECSLADPDHAASIFKVKLTLDDPTAQSEAAELQVGVDCANNENPDLRDCEMIHGIPDVRTLDAAGYPVAVDRFLFPNKDICEQSETIVRDVYVLYNDGADNTYEASYTWGLDYELDTLPPPLPVSHNLAPAESAVQISWELPVARANDIRFAHVLCLRSGDTEPLFDDRAGEAEYVTTQDLCAVDATYDELPEEFATLDPALICATTTGTDTNIRVEGLENAVLYKFVLLTVDDARNVSAVYLGEAEPAPAVDFWEDYDSRGGTAEGGVCLVNSTFGGGSGPTQAMRDFRDNTLAHFALGRASIDAYYDFIAPLGAHVDGSPALRVAAAVVLMPFAGLAAFWEYTSPILKMLVLVFFMALSRRVRRRMGAALPRALSWRRAPAMAMAVVAVLAVTAWTAPAHAQAVNDPYWDDFEPIHDTAPVERSYWNLGFKLGPYTPAIDSEFNLAEGEVGPYEQMFGGSAVMGAIELERFFLWPLGQLGVTASLGWMSKSGNAYQTVECMDPAPDCVNGFRVDRDANGNPIVSEGDTTGFRLIPASLGVVYRFTELDDRFRVPVVPYGKAALSYYLWWITQPDGSIAQAPTMDCPDPADPAMDCDGNRALGGSLGWQVSLGLALRAERLDPQSAQSLRNEYGIEHAGLYAEMTYAQVDGFGSDSRLSVGGFTWFGGLNFEF